MGGLNELEAPRKWSHRPLAVLFGLAENEIEKPIVAKVTMCEWSAGVRAPFQPPSLLVAPFLCFIL